ncbi:MAG TPA: hypothetical protein ENF88_00015 [Candidatus Acetothermia bacterium]|nr:hypothetical protein [Candidatus Acetothermia bacterium]HEX32060.1 hypothetical protein [Candidatus Acetothermia bacterium]
MIVNPDIGKLAIIAAIFGVLLVGGLFINQQQAPAPEPAQVVDQTPAVQAAPQLSLEMLGPVYSEKAVYQDDLIRMSFKTPLTDNGIESDLPFWLHNASGEVITVLWDRCSLQLPSGNTVNIVNRGPDGAIADSLADRLISIAPGGDLFDTIVPVSEITQVDGGLALTTDVLSQGPFQFVLALQVGGDCSPQQIKYYTFQFIIR